MPVPAEKSDASGLFLIVAASQHFEVVSLQLFRLVVCFALCGQHSIHVKLTQFFALRISEQFMNLANFRVGLVAMMISGSVLAESIQLTAATVADINKAMDAGALTSEQLVQLSLARINAYDDAGPGLNAVILVNPNALERARMLDAERGDTGRRSPLHGIPVVIKDNIDTADMPTTAGSFMLKDSIPPDDAYLVQRLRSAGAIILAKLNMSEFASGDAMSSLDGPIYNPHDSARTPSGSSGGTGAAIAAAYAPIGLGYGYRWVCTRTVLGQWNRGIEADDGLAKSRWHYSSRFVFRHRWSHGAECL